jgi:hypothetical protein
VSNTIRVIRAILPVTRAPAETTMPRNEDAPLLFGGGACLGGSAQVRRDRSRSNRRVHRRRFGSRRCTCRSGGPRTYHRSTCGRRLDAIHAGRGSGGSRTRTVEPPPVGFTCHRSDVTRRYARLEMCAGDRRAHHRRPRARLHAAGASMSYLNGGYRRKGLSLDGRNEATIDDVRQVVAG